MTGPNEGVTVRAIEHHEVSAYIEAKHIGFGRRPTSEEVAASPEVVDPTRTFAAFDQGRIVGTASSFAGQMSVPGSLTVPVAGVTNVTVMPTHRRRGVLTEMMRQQVDDLMDRQEPLAVLVAAEAPIYGRFGYGPAIWRTSVSIQTHQAGFAHPVPERVLRFATLGDLIDVAPGIHQRHSATRPGTLHRSRDHWETHLGLRGTDRQRESITRRMAVVAHDDAGVPDGWLIYELNGHWTGMRPTSEVVVHELIAASNESYAALWDFALTQDWAVSLKAVDRPVDDALPWLLADQRQVAVTDLTEFVWARVLDVEACLPMRRYSTTDRLIIEVIDGFLPGQAGRFQLDAGPDGASCRRSTQSPDLTVAARELGASYFGGTSLTRAAGAGLVDEHHVGAVARFDRLFRADVAPWCDTMF